MPKGRVSEVGFNDETIKKLAEDIRTQRIPVKKTQISDDQVTGLNCQFRDTGLVSFFVQYSVDGHRPQMKIGTYPDMSITRARNIARTIVALAERGVDVQEGLHDRLVRELEAKGLRWRP